MTAKTYRQLLLLLQTIPEDSIDCDITVYDFLLDEYIPTEFQLAFSDIDSNVLDPGHPILLEILDNIF